MAQSMLTLETKHYTLERSKWCLQHEILAIMKVNLTYKTYLMKHQAEQHVPPSSGLMLLVQLLTLRTTSIHLFTSNFNSTFFFFFRNAICKLQLRSFASPFYNLSAEMSELREKKKPKTYLSDRMVLNSPTQF